MDMDGQRIAIIAAHEFEDIELEYPLLQWSHEGADVILVPVSAGHHPRPALAETEAKPITGRFGTPMPPEVIKDGYTVERLRDLTVSDVDCVFIPGGFSPDHLRVVPEVVDFVRQAYEEGKIVASICHGPQVLIEAGLVEGKTVTGYKAVRTDLVNAGAEFEDVPAVQDGNLVTGRVPDDLPPFCETVAEALAAHTPELEVA